jgi:hypothetical protein
MFLFDKAHLEPLLFVLLIKFVFVLKKKSGLDRSYATPTLQIEDMFGVRHVLVSV